jgi:hypothetical protein
MEGTRHEIYTDNAPLDRGKISLHEGGTRVPLIIAGPGIKQNVQTQVLASGLDFYPTILSLVGASPPEDKQFDGCDLAPLLTTDPTDPTLVKDADGTPRDTLFWHFPQSENTSAIREGDFKLFRRYGPDGWTSAVYQLTDSASGRPQRVDLEERHDLTADNPQRQKRLDERLSALITTSGGRLPYRNPRAARPLPHQHQAPTILACERSGRSLRISYRNNGASLAFADIIYSPNSGHEWLRLPAEIRDESTVTAELPPEATHYFINLVDEHNFLVIDPPVDQKTRKQKGLTFADVAHPAGDAQSVEQPPQTRQRTSAANSD